MPSTIHLLEIRKSLNVNLNDAVLIFDEAHNLEGICADAASFDFSAGELAACVREVQHAIDIASKQGNSGEVKIEELAQLKGTAYNYLRFGQF